MSHPDPTREYGEHPDEPQHKEWLKTQGRRQGHVKFQGKTGIPTHKLRKDGGIEASIKRMLDLHKPSEGAKRFASGASVKTKALKGKAGDMHKRASFTQKSVPFGYSGVDYYKNGEQKYHKGNEPIGHKFGGALGVRTTKPSLRVKDSTPHKYRIGLDKGSDSKGNPKAKTYGSATY